MAYHSQQMNHLVNGARIDTPSKCKGLFEGITWNNIHKKWVTYQEYGNTIFIDALIIAFYFKCKFNMHKTSTEIGYIGPIRLKNGNYGGGALGFRLERINTKSIINIARELLRAKLIDKQTIQDILNKKVHKYHMGANTSITNGKFYLYYAKALVISSIEKFGTRQKSSEKLGITLKTINYWADLKVIDIRVKPKNKD